MTTKEFRHYRWKMESQWKSGLPFKARVGPNGLGIFSIPTCGSILDVSLRLGGSIGGLAVDECGVVFWTQSYRMPRKRNSTDKWELYRYDPILQAQETVLSFDGKGNCPGGLVNPGKMVIHRKVLWIVDQTHNKILAFSRENYQIIHAIQPLGTIVDSDYTTLRSHMGFGKLRFPRNTE